MRTVSDIEDGAKMSPTTQDSGHHEPCEPEPPPLRFSMSPWQNFFSSRSARRRSQRIMSGLFHRGISETTAHIRAVVAAMHLREERIVEAKSTRRMRSGDRYLPIPDKWTVVTPWRD